MTRALGIVLLVLSPVLLAVSGRAYGAHDLGSCFGFATAGALAIGAGLILAFGGGEGSP